MTRKDFQALANTLSFARECWAKHEPDDYPDSPTGECPEQKQWRHDVRAVASVLADSNPRFDRQRFLAASGYDN